MSELKLLKNMIDPATTLEIDRFFETVNGEKFAVVHYNPSLSGELVHWQMMTHFADCEKNCNFVGYCNVVKIPSDGSQVRVKTARIYWATLRNTGHSSYVSMTPSGFVKNDQYHLMDLINRIRKEQGL